MASLRYYACGQTRHNVANVFAGEPPEVRSFPAGAFLFEHDNGERILYDTGYALAMKGTGISGALYRKLLPPEVTPDTTIESQLSRDGIDPRSIGRVVLSHLHPDHIGGVQYFPDAEFIMSKRAHDKLASRKLKDGIIPALLPPWFAKKSITFVEDRPSTTVGSGVLSGYDVFGDSSYVVVDLPGHARGHLGAFVLSRAVLAGDAAWGNDLLERTDRMRVMPRYITDETVAYRTTAQTLAALRERGVQLYFSHDTYHQTELLAG